MSDTEKSGNQSEKTPLKTKTDKPSSKVDGDAQKKDGHDAETDAGTTYTNVAIDDEPKPQVSGFKILTTLSGRRKYTLILITGASFLAGVTFSLIGPIYPFEASRKGMSTTLIGVVFGLFGVVIFLTAPIFGTYLTKLGPKFTFTTGIFVGGCCNILFGTLYYCPGGTPFIVMSILIRCTEAIGFSAYITSSFAIVSSEFKENIGFTFGVLETGNGLGFMLGPTIGGALYELGGFGLPFYVAGVLVLINGMLAYNFLPCVEDTPAKRKGSMIGLLRNPMVFVPVGCLLLGEMSMATYYSTFAEHAKPLNISVGTIGLLYGAAALLYSIMSLLWGYISDTLDYQAPLMIGGQLMVGIAFLLLGPSFLLPFIPFTITTACIALALLGTSFGSIFIPTMKCMVKGAVELGFENNLDTYAMVSGLFNAAHTLGGFIGPVGIGACIEQYGYPISYTVVGLLGLFWMAVCTVFFTYRKVKRRNEYKSFGEVEEPIKVLYSKSRSLSLSIG